jgi:hypothetical protein
LAPNEKKMSVRERDQERTVTFASSKSLLGRGDLRGTLVHQSNTERGERMPLLQAGVFKHPVVGKGRLEGDWHYKK